MKDSTGKWLEPLISEADLRDIELRDFMLQATMPAAEADNPMLNRLAEHAPSGTDVRGIDWIRFGQLLAARLGWDDYPQEPPSDEGGE